MVGPPQSDRRDASASLAGSEFEGLDGLDQNNQLRDPLLPVVAAEAVKSAQLDSGGRSSCWKRQCGDRFRRTCWIVSILSVLLNIASGGLIVFYFVVLNPSNNHTRPLPPDMTNCSLEAGEEMQVLPINSTTAHFCWSTVNRTSSRLQSPYVLHLSDWFTDTPDYVAYSGVNNSVVLYDLVPFFPYNITLERYTDIGVDPVVTQMQVTFNGSWRGCVLPSSMSTLYGCSRTVGRCIAPPCLTERMATASLRPHRQMLHAWSRWADSTC
jgi:hypothetical protein